MSPSVARAASQGQPRAEGSWPHQLDHRCTLRVGDVLAALRGEFPSLTPSKLRFLDAQGIVTPGRTHAGYRQYSQADVERVRYVLRQQRDHFAPLGVIAARLADLDAGLTYEAVALSAVAHDGGSVGADDAASLAGTTPDVVALLVAEGILASAEPGRVERCDVALLAACARYLEAGADVRELRALVRVAAREAQAAAAAAAPLRRRDDDVQARAAERARVEAARGVFTAAVERDASAGA